MTSEATHLSRARLYVLFNAFERDIRDHLERFVIPDVGVEEALGPMLADCVKRRDEESRQDPENDSDTPLVEFLDLRGSYDLLNRHRPMLPVQLADEVRTQTQSLDALVRIRNRVMHGRPLRVGDPETASSLLGTFNSRYWPELQSIRTRLVEEPGWSPAFVAVSAPEERTLHNLPSPDYDETGLVGRSREVVEVVGLLKRGRESVVTITGEGGIGKTALALDVAWSLVDDVDQPFDAILWTTLKTDRLSASGVQEVVGAVTTLLGAAAEAGRVLDGEFAGSVAELRMLLEGFKVLLVVDNLETVSALGFASLYDGLPETVTFLITSRVGVGELERRYALGPLSERDALNLLNSLIRGRRVSALEKLSGEARLNIVRALRHSPLGIRWFVLAVEAGRPPLDLLRHQDELLRFCIESVYEDLTLSSRDLLLAVYALDRPVTPDELVLLSERSVEEVNRAVQEWTRGSMVRIEPVPDADLGFRVSLTPAARAFLLLEDRAGTLNTEGLLERERAMRAIEERRQKDEALRSLAPSVVRVRSANDIPASQLLRRALLAGYRRDYESAVLLVAEARQMAPDFWEVDRVEAFLAAERGLNEAATRLYLRAYQNTSGEARGVVCHFLGGHLGRNLRDPAGALRYAREAREEFSTPETNASLGRALLWASEFPEAVETLQMALPDLEGRARLIALTTLVDTHRRWGDYHRDEERNPQLGASRALDGVELAIRSADQGTVDSRLLDTMCEAAVSAALCLAVCAEQGVDIPQERQRFLDLVSPRVSRLAASTKWYFLVSAIGRAARTESADPQLLRLRDEAMTLKQPSKGSNEVVATSAPGTRILGQVTVVKSDRGFGFVKTQTHPDGLFFHCGDFTELAEFSAVRRGDYLEFDVGATDRGDRAVRIRHRGSAP